MEILGILSTIISLVGVTTLMHWVISILALFGVIDFYMFWRMKRKGRLRIDQTASFFHWMSIKWCIASQTEIMAEKLPFITKDLSEAIGVKPDDGEIT